MHTSRARTHTQIKVDYLTSAVVTRGMVLKLTYARLGMLTYADVC